MEQTGLSKDDIQDLFRSLDVLSRLSEQCIASNAIDATDSNICHHHSDGHFSDVQTGETAPSSDRRQTTDDARGRSSGNGVVTRAAPSSISSNADTVTHVDLTAESLDRHANIPSQLSIHSTPVMPSNGCIRSNALEATDSVERGIHNRHSCTDQRQLITNATNRSQQTARVSKR